MDDSARPMTDRRRFLAALRYDSPDRLPNHELGLWGQTAEKYVAAGMPEDATGNWFQGCDFLGLDRRDFVPLDSGPIPAYEHEILEQTERYTIYRNRWGIVHKALETGMVRGTRASMDQYLRFPVETREDFRSMKHRYDPTSAGRRPDDWPRRVERWRERNCPLCLLTNASFGIYSHMRRWMGTENLSLAFYSQPALVEEMVEHLTDFLIELTRPALEQLDIDYFNFFEDFAYKTGPLLSPKLFRRFLMPAYRHINAHLRRHGVEFIWLDSDGNPEVLVPLMMESGINCLWPLEVAAGMDPVSLREEFGPDLRLSGGIDKRALAKGHRAIDEELDRRLRPMLAHGGYIPTIDHTVPPDVPYENFMYYMERKMRMLETG
jgi:uroporphyrinogen decarboxylase